MRLDDVGMKFPVQERPRFGTQTNGARLIYRLGRIPLVGSVLRKLAHRFPEGSVVQIKQGHLAGHRWRRCHRFSNGYWLGIHEPTIQECLVREINPGDVYYDLGANAGFFTLLGAKCVGESGRVFAFEPVSENVEALRTQCDLNHLSNCTIVECAVSDSDGEIRLAIGTSPSRSRLVGLRHQEENRPQTTVQAVTIDSFAQKNAPPNFIKVDIEYAELLALRGAETILQSENAPKLLIELHGGGLMKSEVWNCLKQFGYDVFALNREPVDHDNLPHHVLALPRAA